MENLFTIATIECETSHFQQDINMSTAPISTNEAALYIYFFLKGISSLLTTKPLSKSSLNIVEKSSGVGGFV